MRFKPTLKAYKYRIYPNDAQAVFFAKTFGCCRFVWNKMLDEQLQAYKKKELIPRPTPAHYKELIKLHKIESRIKTINAVSDKRLFTIQ
jgi:transposase